MLGSLSVGSSKRSDKLSLSELPESVRQDVEALIGCVAGAVMVEETRGMMRRAGLTDIVLTHKSEYIDSMTDFQDPLYAKIVQKLPHGSKASDYITSLDIAGVKPGGGAGGGAGGSCCAPGCCN